MIPSPRGGTDAQPHPPTASSQLRATRRRVTVALVAILAIAGVGVARIVRSDTTAVPGADYRVASVGAGDVTETVAMNGTVTAVKHAEVNFPIAGSVTAVLVTAGQGVEAGAPLATLESSGLQAAVNAAQATYELALEQVAGDRAALAASRTTTTTTTSTTTTSVPAAEFAPSIDSGGTRQPATQQTATRQPATRQSAAQPPAAQQPAAQQPAAQQTRTPTEADIQSDIAAAYSAEIALAAAREDLARSILVSPISGVVTEVDVAVGEQVGASSTATSSAAPGSTGTGSLATSGLFVIEDQSGYSVIGTLEAGAIGQVHEGDPATISVSTSGTDLTGAVTAVDRVPTTTSGTAVFTVTVGINIADVAGTSATAVAAPLYNGINAKATIVAQHHASVMVVPTSAVHTSSGISTVYVTGSGSDQPEIRIVEIGAVGLTSTEIASGLDFGDQVVLADLNSPIPTTTTLTNANALSGGISGNRRGVIRGN